jgi:membrane-associated protease RseP (regulator of RpoE activity)
MKRALLSAAVLLLLVFSLGQGQSPLVSPPDEEKGTYLGVLISPVPEAVYAQLPELPRGQGVMVNHVLPDSPAAQVGLRRYDLLLEYDGEKITDGEQFARLIRAGKPDQKVKLAVLRGGKRMTAEVTLTLGPILKIAQGQKPAGKDNTELPRGAAKNSPPPTVSVAAIPLDGNRIKVTIEYYQDGSGRLRSCDCAGTPAEIESQIKSLPPRVHELALVALQRIRELELQKQDQPIRPANSNIRRQP